MRITTEQTELAWKSPLKVGDQAPVARATIEFGRIRKHFYNTDDAPGGEYGPRTRTGTFRAFNFGTEQVREIPNLKVISWARSVDQDVAECTLTILNSEIAEVGSDVITLGDEYDLPGIFTFARGKQLEARERWGHEEDSPWSNQIVPDRLVRTYEGYGQDKDLAPGHDPHLYASGVWMIDDVDYDTDGNIALKLRDVGRLLIDHIVFPPVVPYDDYPLEWSKIRTGKIDARTATGGSFKQPPGKATSSNLAYRSRNLTDVPPYIQADGGVQGHYDHHAWKGEPTQYWLSTGQVSRNDKVWWQIDLDDPTALAALNINTRGGPYRVFISVGTDSKWYGTKKIPTREIETNATADNIGVRYVKSITAEKGEPFDVTLPRKYKNVTRVRLTFTKLRDLFPSTTYPHRAGLKDVKLYVGDFADLGFEDGKIEVPIGNYNDYSHIVRWVGAWAGFYWPAEDPDQAWIKYASDGVKVEYVPNVEDGTFPKGRTWGHFQWVATAGIADLTADLFDKQPLMDVIAYVREVTGFSFWIDEAGGMVFRMPNLFSLGNWVTPSHLHRSRLPSRQTDPTKIVVVDEEETLLSYSTKLSSRNVRERVFVADTDGKRGVVVEGYNPNGGTGLMRIAGWSDSKFNRKDLRIAADMIVVRQMFEWRKGKLTIPGNPAIQIDDQIKINERVTSETFYHYVMSISSTLDMDAGTWEYEMETHWLGEDPNQDGEWALTTNQLSAVSKQYLQTIGAVE